MFECFLKLAVYCVIMHMPMGVGYKANLSGMEIPLAVSLCQRSMSQSFAICIVHHHLLLEFVYSSGILLFVYFFTGVIRGSIKGRSGCDRLPNADFWLELPYLVRVGLL